MEPTQISGNSELGSDILGPDVDSLSAALHDLAASRDPALAAMITRFFTAIATEASRGPRFANALTRALREPPSGSESGERPRRNNRRNPSPFDPFAIYSEEKEDGLRSRLGSLDLERLRDIVAEHGMDNDRLAMKWKDPERVIDRIVDRVMTRASKGSAFR